MKTYTKSLIIIIAMLLLHQGMMNAQPTYNSALGYENGITPTPTMATVRAYSANMSVLCFYENSNPGPDLMMTDVTTNTPSNVIPLKQMLYVTDVRIHDGFVYFCGKTNPDPAIATYPSCACYGFVDINCFWSATPSSYNVEYRYLDLALDKTELTKMLVYNDGQNDKLVLLGTETFSPNSPSTLPSSLPSLYNTYVGSAYIWGFRQHFLVEVTNPKTATQMDVLLVNSDNTFEHACDMTLTSSYLTIVGYDMADVSKAFIHRCNKSNVVGTFCNRFGYNIPHSAIFNGYKCCALSQDNIAIADLTDASGSYGFRIRSVDIQTMMMTNSQEVPVPGKTDVPDMIYFPVPKKLILLSHFDFLGNNNDDYVFLRIDPAANTPYFTSGVVENVGPNPYTSMDVLGSDYFVSSGGNYEFVKKAFSDVTAPNCYDRNTLPIKIRANTTIAASSFRYDVPSRSIIINHYIVDTVDISTRPACLD
jgi:hypothetical protein